MVRFKKAALALSLAATLVATGGVTAFAQDHEFHGSPGAPHGGPSFHGGPGFHGGSGFHSGFVAHHDFAHFTVAERAAWTGGAWQHSWHGGRFGWWWGVGGVWYYYGAPIYPYPEYVADFYYDPTPAAPAVAVAPVAGSPPGYWYYCGPSGAYYPYVQTCAAPWTPVPPTPPQQ